jgi:hypothetical protein
VLRSRRQFRDCEDHVTDLWALVDLDGTIADYDGAMGNAMCALQAPSEEPCGRRYADSEEPPHIEARRKLIQRQPGFWRNLLPLGAGLEVVSELRDVGFSLHVLTKGPSATPSAWSEKVEWCRQHLPDAIVTVTSDKSFVYGRVLVDDYPPYFESWLKVRPRGIVVCVAQPWNTEYAPGGYEEDSRVLRYDGSNVAELRTRLALAYSRAGGSV